MFIIACLWAHLSPVSKDGGWDAGGKLFGGLDVFTFTGNSWSWHPLHFLYNGVLGCCPVCQKKCIRDKGSVFGRD